MVSSFHFYLVVLGKVVVESVCYCYFQWTKALGRAHELPFGSIVGYTLLNGYLFCSAFSSKFSPAMAGNIDCNLSLFHLPKDDKKDADNFLITDLKHKY